MLSLEALHEGVPMHQGLGNFARVNSAAFT